MRVAGFSAVIASMAVLSVVGSQARATAISAIADSYTDSSSTTVGKNYGSNGVIAVSPLRVALIQFSPSAIVRTPGGTGQLNLKVFQVKNYTDAISVHLVRGPWTESTVTSRTLPPM